MCNTTHPKLWLMAHQENLDHQLAQEQEQNAGHLAAIQDLQKQYDEKLVAFEVSRLHTVCRCRTDMSRTSRS